MSKATTGFEKLAKAHCAQGDKKHRAGDFEGAIAAYDKALHYQPDYYDAWACKGVALFALYRHEKALVAFDQALYLRPNCHEAWNAKGLTLWQLGRDQEAMAALDRALHFKPDYYLAWNSKGAVASNTLGEHKNAIIFFDKAINIKPDFDEAWYNKGVALVELGRKEEALVAYDQAIQCKPDSHGAWRNKGSTLLSLGRNEEALAAYNQALYYKPDLHEAWHDKSIALFNLERKEEALAACDQALYYKHNYHEAWFNKGAILFHLGREEEAIVAYNQALHYKHNYHEAWFSKGHALVRLERKEEALDAYDQALNHKPDYHEAWFSKGHILSELRREEEAVAAYDRVLHYRPVYPQAWHNRGATLFRLRRKEEAIQSYDRALSIKPNLWNSWGNRSDAVAGSASCGMSVHLTLPLTMQNLALDERNGYESRLVNLREGLKYVTREADPEGWGQLHLRIGLAHYWRGETDVERQPRRRFWEAVESYNTALQTLTSAQFPEAHLELLQDFFRVYLALGESDRASEVAQQGSDLLRRLLDDAQPWKQKQLSLKFASFDQLTVDLAVQQGNLPKALQLAEQSRATCLNWLLSNRPTPPQSENPETTQSPPALGDLANQNTAIIYWHLSPAALTCFILLPRQSPILLQTPDYAAERPEGLVHLIQFEDWLSNWNRLYDEYDGTAQHDWRSGMEQRLGLSETPAAASLKAILNIAAIEQIIEQSALPITQLLLMPHRDLHRFPLHALFNPKFTATYLPAAQLAHPSPHGQKLRLLSLENPKHGQSATQPTAARIKKLAELPHAEYESELICSKFAATRLADQQATQASVLQALQQSHDILHFTGHGFYQSTDPASSALFLSSGDRLTLRDLLQSQISLSAYQLICLSACETAVTGNQTITDEYVGLVSGFLSCGARYVVSSLWTVQSEASLLLMVEFYNQLETLEPIPALKAAQNWLKTATAAELIDWYDRELAKPNCPAEASGFLTRCRSTAQSRLDRMESPPYAHPYFWSAFTITGL